jgi:transposase
MRDIARLDDRVVVDAVLDLLSATGRWRRWTTTFWQWTLGPASS